MNYSQSNKEAWEEAYEHRSEGFDTEDIVKRIRDEKRHLLPKTKCLKC